MKLERSMNAKNWMSILTFGLNKTERTVLNVLIHWEYDKLDCTDYFEMLLDENVACIVLNPERLDEHQYTRLNQRFNNRTNTIILLVKEPEMKLQFPWHLVDLESDFDDRRKKAIKLLEKARISSIQQINEEMTIEDTGFRLNDGFVVLDVETSGLDPRVDEIIRISAMRVANYQIIDQFESLVRVKRPLCLVIENLTGITNEMLASAPTLRDVMRKLTTWYPLDPLVFYNKQFSMNFLKPALLKTGYAFRESRITIDLMYLTARLHPAYFMDCSFVSTAVAKLLLEGSNDYSSDVEMEAKLLIYFLCKLKDEYGFHSVNDILGLYHCDELT